MNNHSNAEEKSILNNITDVVGSAADAVRPTVNAVTPWITWGVGQAALTTVYAVGSLAEATPTVTDALYRGTASAVRKSKRAAKYTKKCVDEYCFGGVTYLSEEARKEKEKEILQEWVARETVKAKSDDKDAEQIGDNPLFKRLEDEEDESKEDEKVKEREGEKEKEEKKKETTVLLIKDT